MKGISICDIQPDGYRGVCRGNQLADYMEDKNIGEKITAFLNAYVDDETQEIYCTIAAACEAKQAAALLTEQGADSEVITYNDEHESAGLLGADFLGYDVCSSNFGTSPIADGLIKLGLNEYDESICPEFFENIGGDIVKGYAENLNENLLFSDREVAEEVCEYMNYLAQKHDGIFYGDEDFSVFAVFSC